MTTEAAPAAADTAPLSLDAAVGLLDAAPVEREEDQPAETAAEPTEAEPTADGEIDPDEPAIDLEDEEANEGDPETPAIAMPKSWAAEDAVIWKDLTPEAQAKVLARETDRDRATQKAVLEASEERKKAEAVTQKASQLEALTVQALTKAAEIFKGKWTNDTPEAWLHLAQTDEAGYVRLRAEYEAEQAALTQVQLANQKQAEESARAFMATKMERIKTEAPDLIDPVKGPERVARLEQRLVENGIPRDVFHTLDAFTIGLANDGFKYRDALARAKAKTPAPVQQRAAVRPTATQAVRSPQRAAEVSRNRFAQTGSIDDAVAVMNSRQQANGRSD